MFHGAERRERAGNANDALEPPIVEELVGNVRGLRVLDLGCGDARYGRAMLDRDASRPLGSAPRCACTTGPSRTMSPRYRVRASRFSSFENHVRGASTT